MQLTRLERSFVGRSTTELLMDNFHFYAVPECSLLNSLSVWGILYEVHATASSTPDVLRLRLISISQ
jgi:hypothetical protein